MKSRLRATPIVLFLCSITILVAAGLFWRRPETPIAPPATDNRRAHGWLSPRRVIRVSVVYDADFDRDRQGKAEELIEQAFGLVNIEWQRYRGEWFEIADMQLRSSGTAGALTSTTSDRRNARPPTWSCSPTISFTRSVTYGRRTTSRSPAVKPPSGRRAGTRSAWMQETPKFSTALTVILLGAVERKIRRAR
jgi:hypothetical protein